MSLSYGQHNARDVVSSDSANLLIVYDEFDEFSTLYEDPRNDSAALGQFQIRAADRLTLTGQYAVNRFFLVEASAGYQRGRVGDVEMQVEFDQLELDPEVERFKYTIYSFPAGDIEMVPLQLSAVVRFRPKAVFNPYLGIGGGYTLVGFDSSGDLDGISRTMDSLRGGQARVLDYLAAVPTVAATENVEMSGAVVEAPSYLEWHVVGGFEYSVRRKWSVYADLRYESTNRRFALGFNGSDSLGISVPDRQAVLGDEYATATYGPWEIPESGLVDGGVLVNPDLFIVGGATIVAMPGLCGTLPSTPNPVAVPVDECEFLLNSEMAEYNEANAATEGFVPVASDGVADPGYYYVKGGSLKYGGATLQIGIRYTF